MKFCESKPFSLGAELELQLVCKHDLSLKSASAQVIGFCDEPEVITPELYQSMVEIKTGVSDNAIDAGKELHARLASVRQACESVGLKPVSAGTHPWSDFSDVRIFPGTRYGAVLNSRQWLARRLMVQGLHVHVGMESGDQAMRVAGGLAYYLPFLLALSSSSPFLEGRDTGLASVRTTFFDSLPTGGRPEEAASWRDFVELCERLYALGAIGTIKDLWWDVRPNPQLGTLEIRLCDATSTVRESTALIALIHLLCMMIEEEAFNLDGFPACPVWVARENKWRALRHGVNAELVSRDGMRNLTLSSILNQIEAQSARNIKAFGYESSLETLRSILRHGSSADRQRRVFKESGGDLPAVTRSLIYELESDRPAWPGGIKIAMRDTNIKKGRNECA